MAIAVCKFGGTSLSDAGRFRRVFAISEQSADRRYIVLSAPGKRTQDDEKITDLFYRAHYAKAPEDRYIFSRIYQRYASIRDELGIVFDLESEFMQIWEKLHLSPDYAASRGEYLCAKMFAAYTGYAFIDAAEVLYFVSNDEIDLPRSRWSFAEKLKGERRRVVIPGFYGTGADGRIRTFTRGGSDISGAVVSVLAGADRYENWTDVDGVYSADPEAIPEAIHHRCVNIHQMHDIAEAGAQVLHPKSLEALFGTGIRTVIRNSFLPDQDGSCICEEFTKIVPCVTGKRGLGLNGTVLKPEYAEDEVLPLAPAGDRDERLAVVSVFASDAAVYARVLSILKPISIQYMHNHMKIIIAEESYGDMVRKIHALLI